MVHTASISQARTNQGRPGPHVTVTRVSSVSRHFCSESLSAQFLQCRAQSCQSRREPALDGRRLFVHRLVSSEQHDEAFAEAEDLKKAAKLTEANYKQLLEKIKRPEREVELDD